MKRRPVLIILVSLVLLALAIKLITSLYLESLAKDKIQLALNKLSNRYTIEIDRVHILLFQAGIEIDSVTIRTDPSSEKYGDLNGKISSIKITGLNLIQALLHQNYRINRLFICDPEISGRIPFPTEVTASVLSPLNLRIDFISFKHINVDLRNKLDSRAYKLKNGILKLYNFHVIQKDTLSQRLFGQFQFQTEEIQAVSSDSIYTITGRSIVYSTLSNTLDIKNFTIKPNFSNNRFMARFKYETDRIEASFKEIYIHDFPAGDYVRSGAILSSYMKIGDMDIQVYRDKRKLFRHKIKPTFQEIIYNYHAPLRIDSIGILHGKVVYTEMVDNAKARGRITFSNIKASIHKVTNDSVYKMKEAFLWLKAEGMFMDKSQISVLLKAKIYDQQNTFTMNGHLSDLELKALNPMLENSAFVVVTAGKIDTMDFHFVANNAKASGNMKLLYHGLAVTVINKETGDTTGLKQNVISFLTNRKLIDSNPLPGKEIREGKIDHERDPERFLFNYCFRSIFSGIRTTVMKNPKDEKKPGD
jgi:hypothetical protein